MSDRYWFDSFPDIRQEPEHAVLDFYRTPYSEFVLDYHQDPHAPYTTASQNRGGIS